MIHSVYCTELITQVLSQYSFVIYVLEFKFEGIRLEIKMRLIKHFLVD